MRVSGRDAETSGRQSHQCPTITAAPRCSPFSVVVTFVLVSVPLSSVLFMSWVCQHSKKKKKKNTSSPVQHAMSAYFQPGSSGFRGRPRTTLPRSNNNDLKNSRSTNFLTSHEDLVALRQLAQDRRKWKELMCAVCSG